MHSILEDVQAREYRCYKLGEGAGHMHHGQQWPPAPDARPTKIAQMLHQDSPGADILHQSRQETALQMILRFQCVLHLIVSTPGPFYCKFVCAHS